MTDWRWWTGPSKRSPCVNAGIQSVRYRDCKSANEELTRQNVAIWLFPCIPNLLNNANQVFIKWNHYGKLAANSTICQRGCSILFIHLKARLISHSLNFTFLSLQLCLRIKVILFQAFQFFFKWTLIMWKDYIKLDGASRKTNFSTSRLQFHFYLGI